VIDLFLIPHTDCIGGQVRVDIRLVADEPTWIHAVDLAFEWDPRQLRLVGCDHSDSDVGYTISGVPGLSIDSMPWDFYGANTSVEDGDGYFIWLSPLTGAANPTMISDSVIATLVFERVGSNKTLVSVLDTLTVDYPLHTRVYAGDVPGLDLLDHAHDAKVGGCWPVPFFLLP